MIPVIEILDQATFEYHDLAVIDLNLQENKYYQNLKIKNVKVTLSKKALGISADFNVHFSVGLVCARCLTTFTEEIDGKLHLDYIAGKDPLLSLEKVELKAGDIDRVYYAGTSIDLSIGIREAIVLYIPAVPLCRKDCLGLCPRCGQNLNVKKCDCKDNKSGLFTPRKKK